MKPLCCKDCNDLEVVNYEGDGKTGRIFHFCQKTKRFVDEDEMTKTRDEDCPLDKRVSADASSKGFYLVEDGDVI